MNKKVSIVKLNNKSYCIGDIKDLSVEDYLKLQKESSENFADLVLDYHKVKADIYELQNKVLLLQYRIDYLEGKISKGDYDKLCLGLMK